MSSEALAWAFKQQIKPSSLKFTLIALCECANYKTGRITPSVAHIAEMTGQNRKTIMSNVAELEARGLIEATGARTGRTAQIKVYQACINGPNQAENEQSQKRDTIPKTGPLKSTVFTNKGSQKRDTEPSREPSSNKKIPKKDDEVAKPEGVTDQVWSDWLKHRKKKKGDLTETAMLGIVREAKKAGWTIQDALIEAISRNWQGFKAEWVEQSTPANDSGGFLGSFQRKQGNGR